MLPAFLPKELALKTIDSKAEEVFFLSKLLWLYDLYHPSFDSINLSFTYSKYILVINQDYVK